MPFTVTIKQLLESGVHFGHQTKRWNPKMKPYIYGARNGIYIIDLQNSLPYLESAYEKIVEITKNGGIILFVGTKKQGVSIITEEALRCGMPYVTERWLGGMLTNFSTIKYSIVRLNELEALKNSEEFSKFTKKEMGRMDRDIEKLQKVLSGIRYMNKIPDGLFIVDTNREEIAVKEANRLNIPIIGMVDTNADPAPVDYIIPGNDDAIRSIKLIVSIIADAVIEGKSMHEAKLNKTKNSETPIADINEQTFMQNNENESANNNTNTENNDAVPAQLTKTVISEELNAVS